MVRLGDYGIIIVSVINLLIFVVVFIIAYIKGDQASISLLVGVAASNATTTVGFWLGSSRGSQKKDDALAAAAANAGPLSVKAPPECK